MNVHLFPATKRGRTGTALAALALLIFIALYLLAEVNDVIRSEGLITIFGLNGMAAAIVGAVLAFLAVRKEHERSLLAFLAIALGLLAAGFILGNLLGVPGI